MQRNHLGNVLLKVAVISVKAMHSWNVFSSIRQPVNSFKNPIMIFAWDAINESDVMGLLVRNWTEN